MIKKAVLLIGFIPAFAFAQKYTAKFEDGTKIDFEVSENNTDQMHKLNILLGTVYSEAAEVQRGVGASYFIPDKMYIHGGAYFGGGTSSIGADGLFFLGSVEKDINQSITLKSTYIGNNTTARMVAKFPAVKKKYFGLHGGIYQKKLLGEGPVEIKKNSATFDLSNVNATELVAGGGMLMGKRMRWSVEGDGKKGKPVMKQGTSQWGLFLDAQIRLVRGFTATEMTQDTSGVVIVSGEKVAANDVLPFISFRIYMEGKVSFVAAKDFGITYLLGIATKPTEFAASSIAPVFGLGIYMGF